MDNSLHYFSVLDDFKALPEFKKIMPLFVENQLKTVSGLNGSSKALFAAALSVELDTSILFITPTEKEAEVIYEDTKFFLPDYENIFLFPDLNVLPFEDISPSVNIIKHRVETLYNIRKQKRSIIITSIRSLCRKILNPEDFDQSILEIELHKEYNINSLMQKFQEMGYEHVSQVNDYGEFTRRGEIIDIYSSSLNYPVRIDFFDNTVEDIRMFHPYTQRSVQKIINCHILPKKEIVVTPSLFNKSRSDIAKRFSNNPGLEIFLKKFESSSTFPGIEQYIPLFFKELRSIFGYFKEAPLIVTDNKISIKKFYDITLKEFNYVFNQKSKQYKIKPDISEILLSGKSIDVHLSESIHLEPIYIGTNESLHFSLNPAASYKGQFQTMIEQLKHFCEKDNTVVIVSEHDEQVKRIGEMLRELKPVNVYHKYLFDKKAGLKNKIKNGIFILKGNLSAGFELKDPALKLICDYEIFGRKKKIRKKLYDDATEIIESYIDLKKGDTVVHVNHGIGLYCGLERIKSFNQEKDYIKIEYLDKDILFVPVEQIGFVQKYIGSRDDGTKIDKLGGKSWDKVKSRVKKHVEDMARQLIDTHAKRKKLKSAPFKSDTHWQMEFESEFEFDETPDQLKAIDDIKNDLEMSEPMDRLVCGDVGYGKTEVALRAVFKAVIESRQVALLVPTTILSQQHYHNFSSRFHNYPVTIEVLNRFKSLSEQKEIIRKMEKGDVDVIIGTHKILGKDIKFKNLGLVIIDEEQKFGVKQKERLKKHYEMVDLLSLSATPIPRTLHMSLIKLRDISTINSPPRDRHPVQTYVMEFNEDVLKEAVYREIKRGGQVYFVHNRVQTITTTASYLQKLLPDISIGVAHGQMAENDLEDVMSAFIDNEFNMLVCTSIIDSGLDITNVNTIFINRADMFGLSQLYQLRGRVGRGKNQAFSYLFYQRDKPLSEQAMKRLQAIGDNTELGSGFKIAMRDLEIRGAGNVLGSEQSGDIIQIGYELYSSLLEEAIAELKNEEKNIVFDTAIDLRFNGFIPDEYIPSEKEKMEIYKKIAAIREFEEFDDIKIEIIDRYGDYPEEIEKLFQISELRIMARKKKILSIIERDSILHFEFNENSMVDIQKITKLVSGHPDKYIIHSRNSNALFVKTENNSFEQKITDIRETIEKI